MKLEKLSPPNVVYKVVCDHKRNKTMPYINEFPDELQELIVCIVGVKAYEKCS